jgi:hypothetical protein
MFLPKLWHSLPFTDSHLNDHVENVTEGPILDDIFCECPSFQSCYNAYVTIIVTQETYHEIFCDLLLVREDFISSKSTDLL